jgi:hypothetical protein
VEELLSIIKLHNPLYVPLVRGVPLEGIDLLQQLAAARGAGEKPGDLMADLERHHLTVLVEKGTQRALFIGRQADTGAAGRYREARLRGRSYPSVRRPMLQELELAHKALLESEATHSTARIIADSLDMSEGEARMLGRLLSIMRVIIISGSGPSSEYFVVEDRILLTEARITAARAAAGGNAVDPNLVPEFHCGELLARLRSVANPFNGQLPANPLQLCDEWRLPPAKMSHLAHLEDRSILRRSHIGCYVQLADSTPGIGGNLRTAR